MKQNIVWLTVVMAMMLTACSSREQNREAASQPIPVSIGNVQHREDYDTVSVSGTIVSPEAPSNVSFIVPGKVIQVGPREGDYVKKDQILASIDPTEYRLALTAAKAQTDTTEVAYKRAEDEHRRMKMLYDSKSLAPNDYEKYKSAYEASREQYSHAAASEKISGKHLADATLLSPVNGFIAKRSVEPGQMAIPGQPVFEIVKLDPVEVNVGVPETDVHRIRTGQKAAVTLPALPGESFEGTVRLINVSADSATRTFMTRITVANPKHILLVGMVVVALIRGDRILNTTTLPSEAVMRDPQGATVVFVYYPDQKRVYAKRVEVGTVHNREVEIKSGLSGNESIVLAGQERLRDGVIVSAIAADAPAGPVGAPQRSLR